MSEPRLRLVPATLHRLRCFLGTEARAKVKPWAPAEEVLDAFHDALRSRRDDAGFWEVAGTGRRRAATGSWRESSRNAASASGRGTMSWSASSGSTNRGARVWPGTLRSPVAWTSSG